MRVQSEGSNKVNAAREGFATDMINQAWHERWNDRAAVRALVNAPWPPIPEDDETDED